MPAFVCNNTATTEISTLPLHDALPIFTRVIMPTGRDIGFLPGRMEEKMQPWVQPAYDALELLLSRPRKPEQFDQKKQSKRKNPQPVTQAAPPPPQPPPGG